MKSVEWGEYKLGDLFKIESTNSFNADMLVNGTEYDYVTRTSTNQGIMRTTGFVNSENINPPKTWSLGLLQMDFFYRTKPWYAGQFVRKIIPKIAIPENPALYFTSVLNKYKTKLLSVLVRNVDETFNEMSVKLPTKNNKIDFDFMESFIAELKAERLAELKAYLQASGLDDYELTDEEKKIVDEYKNHKICLSEFSFSKVFNRIEQGRRLKKADQQKGSIPFVMSGITNTGVVGYISNPVAFFPENSITIDIFGNSFYRKYAFGAGDDTGVYWNDRCDYSTKMMLYFTAAMEKTLKGKFSYGKKLRSSQSLNFKMQLPTKDGKPDYELMEILISAIQKLVIKDVVLYADNKIKTTETIIEQNDD